MKVSIRTKLLSFIPIMIMVVVLIAGISYRFAKGEIEEQIEKSLIHEAGQVSGEMEVELAEYQRIGETLSDVVGVEGTELDESSYEAILGRTIGVTDSLLGIGAFFEPYTYDENIELFEPYSLRAEDGVEFSAEPDQDYDYTSLEWYVAGVEAGVTTWIEPFYDETLETDIVAVITPFYAEDDSLLGVISSDIEISSLQKMTEDIVVGEAGWAFLVDGAGNLLYHPTADKIADDPALAGIIGDFGEEGLERVSYDSGDALVSYNQLDQNGWALGLVLPESEVYAGVNNLLRNIILIAIVVIILTTLAVFLLAAQITKPIRTLNNEVKYIAEGDLSRQIAVKTKDETGELTTSFNLMVSNLRDLVGSVRESVQTSSEAVSQLSAVSEETMASTEQINRAIEDVAEGTTTAAASAEESSRKTTELSEQLSALTVASKSLTAQASQVEATNKNGSEQTALLQTKAEQTDGTIKQVETVVEDLTEQMNEVASIVSTIASISEQTNLLALNASIEAARAGEHGRGFAVVAEEVRKLAEEAASATGHIRGTMEEIQAKAKLASSEMGTARMLSAEQFDITGQTVASFDQIAASNLEMMKLVSNMTNQISSIETNKEKVVSAIGEIAVVMEETAAASEEVSASANEQLTALETITLSAEDLQTSSEKLMQQIEQFKS
ncbi:methyl-accepting chemotaxis protein [Marinilactibacillus sp. Marseille-P9653]|uniref:methyl-accepting chemotaxis protein n=1 Tax=Marinilactibacillus sp. Marseille-P9653 TaxID=2866583 RepID=UPI001CE3CA58|nr:methyl-accepting chemotaxis protein [Marinilactibacillus sp. Marseille-P9653]